MSKIVVLGLDGLNPELVETWANELTNLKEMQQEGIWGAIKSTVPPIAAPAWTCAQCGRNPGAYGLWNYTYRDDFSYGEPRLVNARVIDERVDCLYKILPKMGQKVALINVPMSYPPHQIHGGYCIADFKGPNLEGGLAWPESLGDEIANLVGRYIPDMPELGADYHLMDKDKLVKRIYDAETQRFRLLKYFIHEKKCDYIFAVITGCSPMSHLLLRYTDEKHRFYDPESPYTNALKDYYVWIDKKIGNIRDILPSNIPLIVISAYSIQRCDGRINLNEWLIQEGYMTLYEYPSQPTGLKALKINWANTRVWSAGDSGKIYLNCKGREPGGIVEPKDYDTLLDELANKLQGITDERGRGLNTEIFWRDDIHFGPYAEYGPDLFICFDEYHWNTSELVGYGQGNIYSFDAKEIPDNECHGLYGYFCIIGPDIPANGELKGISILSGGPTVLDIMGLKIPEDMEGSSILEMAREKREERPAEKVEKAIRSRLDLLGY